MWKAVLFLMSLVIVQKKSKSAECTGFFWFSPLNIFLEIYNDKPMQPLIGHWITFVHGLLEFTLLHLALLFLNQNWIFFCSSFGNFFLKIGFVSISGCSEWCACHGIDSPLVPLGLFTHIMSAAKGGGGISSNAYNCWQRGWNKFCRYSMWTAPYVLHS